MLYGRRDECAALDDLVARARGGRSAVLVIRGEPGIGKSALLGYAAEQAEGMRVLRAVGVESESELPYAALHQLVHGVIDRADDLAGRQRQALRAALGLEAGESDRFAVSAAVLNLLAELSEEQPLLCLVDDAQWLDRASADALLFATRRLEAEPIAALLAVREPAERQLEIRDLPSMPLSGLDPDAASALLDARSDGAMTLRLRQRLVESSAGNPLALIELPTALSDQQPVSLWALGERFPLTATLERSFLDRVQLLPDDAQRLLLLAASNEGDDADVILQAAHDMEVAPAAVAAVEDSGLLRFAGHRLQFRHPLVRSAIYESAHDDDRRQAHGALARALQAETHADRRAWHQALAAVGTDEAVAAELESTAERAQRRSGYAAAARALNRAAQLTPGTVDRARRLVQAGDAAWIGGDKQAAMALLDTADGLDPPPRLRAEILRLRAIMQLRAGDPVMAHDLFVAAADTTDDASKALWLLMLAAEASTYAGRMDWLEALGNRAGARNVSSPRDGFVRSMLSGIAHTLRGEYDKAIPLLRDSVELAEHTTNPHELVSAGSACLYLGDELGALRFYQRAEDECRRRSALVTLPFALEFVAHAQTVADRYPAAVAAATEGEQLARETGQIASRAHHLSILALVAGKQGREEECLTHAGQALEIALPHGLVFPAVNARWAIGLVHLANGRAEEALAAFHDIAHVPGTHHKASEQRSAPDRFEAAVRAGRLDVARQALETFSQWPLDLAPAWGKALLSRCQAMLASGDEAETLFVNALDHHSDGSRPFERARTELAFGEFLRRERRRTDARVHLRSAIAIFDQLGAESWAERARVELRATGETARRRDPSTLDDLTPQELQIAKLAAQEGLNNPQIADRLYLSRRTIEYHLRKVYSKLGVASRTELSSIELG